MIAELAAANAAFEVIKKTIVNGQEIYAAGDALAKYFGLKTQIQKKAHEHGYKSDLQAFMATEQLKEKEEELKNLMIYTGRAGMWTDWLQFQADMKHSREEAEKKEKYEIAARKQKIIDAIVAGFVIAAGGVAILLGVWILLQFVH